MTLELKKSDETLSASASHQIFWQALSMTFLASARPRALRAPLSDRLLGRGRPNGGIDRRLRPSSWVPERTR